VTTSLVNSILEEIFQKPLTDCRFEKVDPRKYVRRRIGGVHDVVLFHSSTADIVLTWGFSFDFIPHISGRYTESVKWHRTAKSAIRDLAYSGLNRSLVKSSDPEPGARMWTSHGEERFREDALKCRDLLLPKALQQMSAPKDIRSFRGLFEAQEEEFGKAFSNYYHFALAYSFYFAKIGETTKARAYMSEWLKRSHHREETQRKISELFEAVAAKPLTLQ